MLVYIDYVYDSYCSSVHFILGLYYINLRICFNKFSSICCIIILVCLCYSCRYDYGMNMGIPMEFVGIAIFASNASVAVISGCFTLYISDLFLLLLLLLLY